MAPSLRRTRRNIELTEAEFQAIVECAVLHGQQHKGNEGSVKSRLVDAALTRVIRKWHAAAWRPRT